MAYRNAEAVAQQRVLIDLAIARVLPPNKVAKVSTFSESDNGLCDGHTIEFDAADEVYIEALLFEKHPLVSSCYVYHDVTRVAGSIPVDAALEFVINFMGWD